VEVSKETARQGAYFREHQRSLLADYMQIELEEKERIVLQNDYFVALVPFWAVWPYENKQTACSKHFPVYGGRDKVIR
jgi:UDPglucose--hexose-1-phosphate uridylyltransferase